ncbi:MAG: DUF373 family protein [Candidatus Aenigmarchaeota archaeon]|nr:DUF373 family protein [Candidatus Aenigmarchaeota archaeon]
MNKKTNLSRGTAKKSESYPRCSEGGILVLNIDRDNDLGEKTGISGPVIGKEENLEAAKKLAVADPGESDANCIFGAVKEYDELHRQGHKVVIATITGDRRVGTTSDMVLGEQLEEVIMNCKPSKVVFVSDGAEDEFIMPLVQSRVPILSVKRIIVRQSVKLESDYYVMLTFFKELLAEPRNKRVLLGLPALVLVTYAIYGSIAWRFTVGLTGVYLIIKGFQLEDMMEGFVRELKATLAQGRLSFFLYSLAAVFLMVGVFQGYNTYNNLLPGTDLLKSSVAFVDAGLEYYLFSVLSFLTAKLLIVGGRDRKIFKYLTYYALAFSTYIMFENAFAYITAQGNLMRLVISVIASFMILSVAFITERVAFSK